MYLRKELTKEDIEKMKEALRQNSMKLKKTPCCDFCGSDAIKYVYASQQMSTGEYQQCWRWVACWECATYVENKNWEVIEQRIVDTLALLQTLYGRAVMHRAAKYSLMTFLENAIEVEIGEGHEE
jgi:Fe-S-cluster-containing hydrogenase component 2